MIVLGMLSVLLLMGVAFSVTMRTERAGASNMRHAAMARHILDTAIVRTMSDLDKVLAEQGDLPVPTGVVVAVSTSSTGGEGSVNPLCYEASLHLPADQLIAAAYSKAQWLPIYGDVRITANDDKDPAYGDSPVGRYSYVILNNSGLLDPNVIGASNRLFGLSPCEVDIEGDNNRVLGLKGADNADRFLETRDDMGHFATMRDFLSASNDKHAITNLLGLLVKDVEKKRFSTNCFFVGSLAIDDLAPPTGVQTVGSQKYPIRKPKFSLRERLSNGTLTMIDPADIISDNDWCNDFLEAVENSFAATYEGQGPVKTESGYLPQNFFDPFSQNKRFRYTYLAARNLLEMMDDDGCPGGTKKHDFAHIGKGEESEDKYLAAFGVSKWNWDRLPCVEPVPMLDNLVILGGFDNEDSSGLEACLSYEPKRVDPPQETPEAEGNVTGLVCKVSISLLTSSAVYPAWNVPSNAEGDYRFNWRLLGLEGDSQNIENLTESQQKFVDAFEAAAVAAFPSKVDVLTPLHVGSDVPYRFHETTTIEKILSFEFPVEVNPSVPKITEGEDGNLKEYIPDEFGLLIRAVGVMGRGVDLSWKSDVVQVVPCQRNEGIPESYNPLKDEESCLEVYLSIKRDEALKKEPCVLGATFALDPRFAYEKKSWIRTPGCSEHQFKKNNYLDPEQEEMYDFQKSLEYDLDGLNGENYNPLTTLYLKNPRQEVDTDVQNPPHKNLFQLLTDGFFATVGGVCDTMRSFAEEEPFKEIHKSDANTAAKNGALSAFFDPEENDDSPWAFTRVGQLGFVPIGTHRTIALMDGFDNAANADLNKDLAHVEVRQRVLDYFTMNPPQDDGSGGGPVKSAKFTSRIGLNPPTFPEVDKKNNVVAGDANLLPLTAALNGCPLREWEGNFEGGVWKLKDKAPRVDWKLAQQLAAMVTNTLGRTDVGVGNVDGISGGWDDAWDDADGVTRSLSVLGRAIHNQDGSYSIADEVSIDKVLRDQFQDSCDFDREGVIRNTAEMLTTRQQLFTILLKADSFTPKFGFSDAEHGTSLASVQAVAHVWRDPEPLRNAKGEVILDGPDGKTGNPIHAWVLLDLYQF